MEPNFRGLMSADRRRQSHLASISSSASSATPHRHRVGVVAGLVVAGVLAVGSVSVTGAPPAEAGCQGGWTPWGGGTTCDGPIAQDGTFQRCVTAGAMGFGGTNCYLLNINNIANQIPYVGP